MDESKKKLYGSESRDTFRWWHKNACSNTWYGLDIDFVITDTEKILAVIDYKKNNDSMTWTEKVAYDDLMEHGYKVYIAKEKENTELIVYEYLGNYKISNEGEGYMAWELKMREKQ